MEKKIYKPGQDVQDALAELESHRKEKPGDYQSPWEDALQSLLQQIRKRDPFRYVPEEDGVYRQAVDRYIRMGREAMMDTMGRAAGLTGGYGNSYAQSVGQQAYQKYLLALSARLPQFQQMALERYQAQGRDLADRFQTLHQQDQSDFDRYTQKANQYYGELGRLQDAYDRASDRDRRQFEFDQNFDYRQQQDLRQAERLEQEALRQQQRFEAQQAYQRDRDRIQDEHWERDFLEGRRRHDLEMRLRQAELAARNASRSSGSRGGSRGGSREETESGNRGPSGRFDRDQYYGSRGSGGSRASGGTFRRPVNYQR